MYQGATGPQRGIGPSDKLSAAIPSGVALGEKKKRLHVGILVLTGQFGDNGCVTDPAARRTPIGLAPGQCFQTTYRIEGLGRSVGPITCILDSLLTVALCQIPY